ncbi:MAG: discoidin domain-containing protein [Bacteroidales bacterium]|nr:discoidin domain-containing protein [Bacteroidales bacterium]
MRRFLSLFFLVCLFVLINGRQVNAQTPVAIGNGSYASFPPANELEFVWDGVTYYDDYNFVYNNPIYVADGETRPIPTNDWWTRVLIDQYGGLLFAYPLVMEPTAQGLKVQYPIGFNASGSDLDRGTGLLVKADNYTPAKAIASNWSDWAVEMKMPGTAAGTNMTVTMAHGIPFTYIESSGINPVITASAGASYFTASGAAASFPVASGGSFIVSSEGRLFGIHLGSGVTADITGRQHITVDLGASYSLNALNLFWETAYAKGYVVQTSTNNSTWTTHHTITNGDGGTDNLSLSGSARYVRILLNERGTIFAYSLFEIQVMSGSTNVALNKSVTASSNEQGFTPNLAVDGNMGTRWASLAGAEEKLVINMNNGSNHFTISALKQYSDLTEYNNYAHNKPIDTKVDYSYDVAGGKVNTTWTITTTNLNGGTAGNTIQGFIPHHYKNTVSSNVTYTSRNYVTARGSMRTAIGRSFSFSYKFGGILPSFTSPYKNSADANSYNSNVMYALVTEFANAKNSYGADTYWGGKDLVNLAKYTLMAKELNHQSYEKLKAKTREALVDWLTYTPGEPEHYFARYDRWKAIVGFDQSYGSAQFTDNHFHYGYLTLAAALYGMVDSEFLSSYSGMLELVTKQYANWVRNDNFLPYFRTFDPWIGHSYAGGTSSGGGNNQESTSEAMQSWIGMFLLGEAMGNTAMRDAGAFGYVSEAAATLEYWFDWDEQNLPAQYPHNIVGILWNGGYAYGTYFSASPVHIHGIQYLPVCPGFKYLAQNKTWAAREYADMMNESRAVDGHTNELDFGDDWAHVALGFRLLYDPAYVSNFINTNLALGKGHEKYIMDYEVSGMTYFYTHAIQNLGNFSFNFYTNFPSSSVFEKNGAFSHAVVYNSSASARTCNVYNAAGGVVASFSVPAKTLFTYPELPKTGQAPDGCYALTSVASATSGNSSAPAAVDGSMGTRWIADNTNPCVFNLDLGVKCDVSELSIAWEAANASAYTVQGSNDGSTWTTVRSFTGMPATIRTDVINNFTSGYRYIRLNITSASTSWPYSIYEINTCGVVSDGGSTPVTGKPIPGKIEAESYDRMSGIQTEATTDIGGGQNVGWIDAGDWLEFDVAVAEAGTYTVNLRAASPSGGASAAILSGGVQKGTLAITSTGGWQVWTTVSTTVQLSAGNQVLRVLANTGGFNINWIEFVAGGDDGDDDGDDEIDPTLNLALNKPVYVSSVENADMAGTNAVDGSGTTRWSSAFSDPQWIYVDLGSVYTIGRVKVTWETAMASNYQVQVSENASAWTTVKTITGNSSAVNDHTGLTATGRYVRIYGTTRSTVYGYSIFELEVYGASAPVTNIHVEAESYSAMNGIALETTSDAGGGQNVGWIDAGDWMEYSVNIPSAGTYTISYRVASSPGGGQLILRSGSNNLATTNIAATGGWQVWTTLTATANLGAGQQTLRLYAQAGGFNINWFEISAGLKEAGESLNTESTISFNVFPNPVVDELNLLGNMPVRNVSIFNVAGKLVYNETYNEYLTEVTVATGNLESGIYFIRAEGETSAVTRKFIKQ